MSECKQCGEHHTSRSIYPALMVATLAGVAFTYFLMRKGKEAEEPALDKVVNLCQSAADKLDAFANQAIAS